MHAIEGFQILMCSLLWPYIVKVHKLCSDVEVDRLTMYLN